VEAEEHARRACQVGDVGRATTLLLEAYGAELLGFLRWLLRDPARGDDVFSDLTLDAWRGLPGFDWRCSCRTWLYVLARRAAARNARARRTGAQVTLSESAISGLVERLRTETAPHLRTDVKDEIRKLRECLPEDDQVLLVLRVDRRMSWREISLVMAEEPLEEADRATLEARLRKRFQLVKDRLRELAEQSGLLSR
jgi:RNA polymerase sigma factor (sigma-70 family)